ncbi:MAG: DUF2339 domain-containing protein, partial [Planctomycetota bacterium]
MEGLILLAVLLPIFLIAGSIAGMVAAARLGRLSDEVAWLKRALKEQKLVTQRLEERLDALSRRAADPGKREAPSAREPGPAPAVVAPVATGKEGDRAQAPPVAADTPESEADTRKQPAIREPEAAGAGKPDAPSVEAEAGPQPVAPEASTPPPSEKKPAGASAPPPPEVTPARGKAPAPSPSSRARGERKLLALHRMYPAKKAGAKAEAAAPAAPAVPVADGGWAKREAEAAKRAAEARAEWWQWFEETVGKRWTTWAGAVLVIVAMGLGVKLAFERDWLPPIARVLLGIVLGVAVVAVGVRFIRRDMRALGQGLVGTGIAILYVSSYGGLAYYEVYNRYIAFVLLLLTTAAGMALAVRFDAISIAFLALFGGFLTPVMIRTGKDPRDALFTYLLLLDLGVLGVAFFKRWRAMDVLAFLGTWGYFLGWFLMFHRGAAASPAAATAWACVFFTVFLLQPFAFHLRSATPVTGERFAASVVNAFVAFAFVYAILGGRYTTAHGLVVLAMSAAYLGLGSVTRSRIPDDVRAVFAFLALAVTGFVVAVPILLEFHGVTAAWAAQAPLILYLAYRYSYYPARLASIVPLALAVGRIFVYHWWRHDEPFTPVFNGEFATAAFVAVAGWACSFVHHLGRKDSRPEERMLKVAVGLAGAFLALTLLHADIWQWLGLTGGGASARWATSLVWT